MAAFSGPPQPPHPPQPNLENCEIKAVQSDRIIARGECIVMLPGAVPPVPAIPVQDLEGFNTQPHNNPRHLHVVMDTGEHVGVIDDDHSEYILPKFAGSTPSLDNLDHNDFRVLGKKNCKCRLVEQLPGGEACVWKWKNGWVKDDSDKAGIKLLKKDELEDVEREEDDQDKNPKPSPKKKQRRGDAVSAHAASVK